jgi:hypothetical protein
MTERPPWSCAALSLPPISSRAAQHLPAPSPPKSRGSNLDIDRDKARTLGMQITDIFIPHQATLGGDAVFQWLREAVMQEPGARGATAKPRAGIEDRKP